MSAVAAWVPRVAQLVSDTGGAEGSGGAEGDDQARDLGVGDADVARASRGDQTGWR